MVLGLMRVVWDMASVTADKKWSLGTVATGLIILNLAILAACLIYENPRRPNIFIIIS